MRIGQRLLDRLQILEGLAPGTPVIVEGVQAGAEGRPVRPVQPGERPGEEPPVAEAEAGSRQPGAGG